MNIQDAIKLRRNLENDLLTKIQLRVNRFTQETGLKIDSINIGLMVIREDGKSEYFTAISNVDVIVKL